MRTPAFLCGASASLLVAAAAIAQAPTPAPAPPKGNFGGGAVTAPPLDHFGPGSAVVGLRALGDGRLQIEATVRGSCAGGDIQADTKVAADGSFSADGSTTQEPSPDLQIKTTYKIAGTFSAAAGADGTISATIVRRGGGPSKRCKSGTVAFGVRRPTGEIGKPGPAPGARYYGTTSQRGVGPRRPIVLRVSADGERIARALFGESVRCSDGTTRLGVEAPRTNLPIDADGRVDDHERSTIRDGDTVIRIDDRFTAQLGEKGARGTFSLSDRTVDRASGRTIQTCRSGKIRWTAAP